MLDLTQNGDIAYVCLKVFEKGSSCYINSSFYSIFLSKSPLKSVTPRQKEGGGALNGKNTVDFKIDSLRPWTWWS